MAAKNKPPRAQIRAKARAVIASFSGRFGVHEDVLAMWVALMGTELRVRPERLIEALDILDTMPPLGTRGNKPTILRDSILHLAKRLGLDAAGLKEMMDRPNPGGGEIGVAPVCGCGQTMVRCEIEVAAPFWSCPVCHPDTVKQHARSA